MPLRKLVEIRIGHKYKEFDHVPVYQKDRMLMDLSFLMDELEAAEKIIENFPGPTLYVRRMVIEA